MTVILGFAFFTAYSCFPWWWGFFSTCTFMQPGFFFCTSESSEPEASPVSRKVFSPKDSFRIRELPFSATSVGRACTSFTGPSTSNTAPPRVKVLPRFITLNLTFFSAFLSAEVSAYFLMALLVPLWLTITVSVLMAAMIAGAPPTWSLWAWVPM